MRLKNFFRENGYMAVKLIVIHIAMSIFALSVYFPFNTTSQGSKTQHFLALILGIFSIIFYFFMIYQQIWELGAKDELKIVNGKKKAYIGKGFLIGLIAAIPDFIICFGYLIFWFFQSYEWATNGYYLLKLGTTFWEGMFMAVYSVLFNNSAYMFIFVPFVSVIFAGISYIFGMKNIRLMPVGDNPEEEERRREMKKLKKERKQKGTDTDDDDELI